MGVAVNRGPTGIHPYQIVIQGMKIFDYSAQCIGDSKHAVSFLSSIFPTSIGVRSPKVNHSKRLSRQSLQFLAVLYTFLRSMLDCLDSQMMGRRMAEKTFESREILPLGN
jgi:hypothetical protein